MYDEDTLAFIKEREEKLGSPMIWRSYATWFAELGRERREFGLFLYTDGRTLILEDFFRPATILGYELGTKREEERKKNYRKLEIRIPLSNIDDYSVVTRKKAEKSLSRLSDLTSSASRFEKIVRRTVLRIKAEERVFFFEMPEYKTFTEVIQNSNTGE